MYVSDWSMYICYSFQAQIVKPVVVLPPVVNPHDILKKSIIKRELDCKDKNAVTKQKNDNASGEIKSKWSYRRNS